MPTITRRYVHDVAHRSNLDLILRGFVGALNRFTDVLGSGLNAIALALSTPQDNSAQVQAQLDKLTAELKPEADAFQRLSNEQDR